MSRLKLGTSLLLAALILAATICLNLQAQNALGPRVVPEFQGSVQDALQKPYPFHFNKPTPLDEVAKELGRSLQAPVAIDRAAIGRLGLKINDEVQLELEGVRLKTGLKLLLDQLDLTYKVVPEDNLLIITDATGSAEPIDQVLVALKSLHRDLHALQDDIDAIYIALGLDAEPGARLRKPTIIEEMPPAEGREPEKGQPKDHPPGPVNPRSRPGL